MMRAFYVSPFATCNVGLQLRCASLSVRNFAKCRHWAALRFDSDNFVRSYRARWLSLQCSWSFPKNSGSQYRRNTNYPYWGHFHGSSQSLHRYIQRGPKKCTHSVIVNIFGTKWHVVTILARYYSLMFAHVCTCERFYLQQDGAPPHHHRHVRAYLDDTLPGRLIGRRGAIDYHHGLQT
jgi:hypothetical protein